MLNSVISHAGVRETPAHEAALRDNRAPSGLLHAIATKYYDGLFGPGDHGRRTRLLEALGADEQLTRTAWEGVLRAPYRDDLPSPRAILNLQLRGRMSYFTLPVLTGLACMSREDLLLLEKERLQTALAFRLVFHGFSQEADWYAACVEHRSELVAKILILFGRELLRAGETSIPDFHSLMHYPKHAEVARKVTGPLLRAFPVRARQGQLRLLDELLWSGIRNLDDTPFRTILNSKLNSRSMTHLQRTRWLAAGLACEPGSFLVRLSEHVGGSERQLRSLTEFFTPSFRVPWLVRRLDPAAMEFLIRTVGGVFEPVERDGFITVREEASDRVHQLISQLASSPDAAASFALKRLVSDEDLSKWRPALQYARDSQRVVRRDAHYVPPSAAAVIAALGDGPPVSAADLRELVVDRLERVALEVKRTDADLWQLFWNQDSHGRPTEPKAENPCRDAVLTLLRAKLPAGCQAKPEVVHAGKRRADIGISFSGLKVPVEIKKNSNSDIWRCVRNQLLLRYANDPATEGLGIYLVLWFGPRRNASVEKGPRPQTWIDLRDLLVAHLTPDERRRAAVIVMDVTVPDPDNNSNTRSPA